MTRSLFSFKRFVLASSLAGLAAATMAQTVATPPTAADAPARHAREHHRADPAQRLAQREARLKQELKITADQKPAWNVFTASLLPPGPKADRPDREALRKMTTPQRIEHMRTVHAQRAAAMESRAEATLRLYAALSPAQQQVFDERMATGPRHGPQHPHHRGAPPRPEPSKG